MHLSSFSVKFIEGSKIYQYLAGITGTFGIISSEMHYGWPSPSLPILTSGNYTFRITEEEGSWLAIMTLLGAVVGAFITGAIIDRTGRKKIILFSSFPFTISWIMIGLAESSVLLHISRFLAGMTDGMSFTAVPMYLGEIAEPKIRGLLASMCPVSIVVGLLLINILGCYLPINITAFVATSIPIILFCTFIWVPESPYFLLMRNDYDKARTSLQVFRGNQDVEKELARLTLAVKEQNEIKGKCSDLLTKPSNRKALLIALGLRTVQQLSGTTAITIYCKTIFEEAHDFVSPKIATIIYFSIQLFLSVLCSFIVDISGRRPLLIISVLGTAITVFFNGAYLYIKNCTDMDTASFSFVPVVMLICFVIIFSIGLQTIPLLVMSEMFPTDVKAFALCMADIYFSVIASVITKFFQLTTNAYGMHVPFFTFFICSVIGLFFIIFFVPETKGKTLEEIQSYLKGEYEINKKNVENECYLN